MRVAVDEFHGTPRSLVEHAIRRRNEDLRAQRRGRGEAWDEYWCVFDCDEHPYIDWALREAEANQIGIAFSNPCVELWFTLHFADQTAWINRQAAKKLAREHLKCGKSLTPEALSRLGSLYVEAKSRAQALEHKHELDGSPLRSNPSSSVWELVERICDDS